MHQYYGTHVLRDCPRKQESPAVSSEALRALRESALELPPESQAELRAFKERLARRGSAQDAARTSLIQRVREFVAKHGFNGGKSGREDYTKLVPISDIDPLRIAVQEYDRVRGVDYTKPLPLPAAPSQPIGSSLRSFAAIGRELYEKRPPGATGLYVSRGGIDYSFRTNPAKFPESYVSFEELLKSEQPSERAWLERASSHEPDGADPLAISPELLTRAEQPSESLTDTQERA